MIAAIIAFYEAPRDQTSPPSMTNCSITNVLSLCCSGESKKYNFEPAQAFLPGGNRGFIPDFMGKHKKQEEVKDHSQTRMGGDPQCCVTASHTLPHTLSSFLCSSVDSSTPYSHEIPETIKATHKSQETKATTILKHIHVTGHHRAERGLFLLPVPGIEPGASCVLGKHSATELYP